MGCRITRCFSFLRVFVTRARKAQYRRTPSKAPMYARVIGACALVAAQAALVPPPALAQSALSGEPIRVSRATGVITLDGDLADEAWRTATRVEKWDEAN